MQTNGQEQQQEPTQTYSPIPLGNLAAVPVLNPPDEAAQNAQIASYLDAICAQMPAGVPTASVEDVRREMREHLEAAVVAYCELGQEKTEAVQSALAQFGTPRTVAHRWQQEWAETLSETKSVSVWQSLKMSLKTWGAVNIVAMMLCMALPPPMRLACDFTPLHALARDLVSYALVVVLPLAAGAWIGLRLRRHAIFCALISNLTLSPLLAIGWVRGLGYWWHCYDFWLTGSVKSAMQGRYSAPVCGR